MQTHVFPSPPRTDRGIDVVRNEIQSFASTMRFGSKGFKLIILDECDSMTKDAQFALRRIIEKYTKHTRFCLIGNYVSKVIPALQSRCTRFRFAPLGPEAVRERVEHVVRCEQLDITAAGVDAVRDLGAGDMRRTLNILQSSFLAAGDRGAIDADDVYAAMREGEANRSTGATAMNARTSRTVCVRLNRATLRDPSRSRSCTEALGLDSSQLHSPPLSGGASETTFSPTLGLPCASEDADASVLPAPENATYLGSGGGS